MRNEGIKIVSIFYTLLLSYGVLFSMERPEKFQRTGASNLQEVLSNALLAVLQENNTVGTVSLIQQGADVTLPNENGEYPLQIATNKNNQAAMDAIYNKLIAMLGLALEQNDVPGIQAVMRAGLSAETVLHKALDEIRISLNLGRIVVKPETVQFIFSLKPNINSKDLFLLEQTPLHKAAAVGIAQALLKRGADVHAKDIFSDTPLHTAFNQRVAQVLIQAGANLEAQNDALETPLHMAVRAQKYSLVAYLLDAGANPNAQNNKGNTPLHVAAKQCDPDPYSKLLHPIISLLMEKGANTAITNAKGLTPLQVAQQDMCSSKSYKNAKINTLLRNSAVATSAPAA